jgi:dissimilatory sulfite reductase (desulfoviridin) alpha/beta subunit
MLWFLRGLRRGVVTTSYPAERDEWARALPSPPAFHSRLLTPRLADRLVEGCASGALAREGEELLVDLGRCSGCGRCLELGGEAVEPSGEALLTSFERRALRKRVPIGGGERGG